nr:hypothetical protein Iba_scaffold11142CG0010 [Ipomoea batatas]
MIFTAAATTTPPASPHTISLSADVVSLRSPFSLFLLDKQSRRDNGLPFSPPLLPASPSATKPAADGSGVCAMVPSDDGGLRTLPCELSAATGA